MQNVKEEERARWGGEYSQAHVYLEGKESDSSVYLQTFVFGSETQVWKDQLPFQVLALNE